MIENVDSVTRVHQAVAVCYARVRESNVRAGGKVAYEVVCSPMQSHLTCMDLAGAGDIFGCGGKNDYWVVFSKTWKRFPKLRIYLTFTPFFQTSIFFQLSRTSGVIS